jgi:hypothetical protein
MRDSVKAFAEKMEEILKAGDKYLTAWETESMLSILDELEDTAIELRSYVRRFITDPGHADGKPLMNAACLTGVLSMQLFSLVCPVTCHNKKGVSIHAMPRVEPENHLVWDQKNRKECGK